LKIEKKLHKTPEFPMDLKKRAEKMAKLMYEQLLPDRIQEWDALSPEHQKPWLDQAALEIAAAEFSTPIGDILEKAEISGTPVEVVTENLVDACACGCQVEHLPGEPSRLFQLRPHSSRH